MKSNIKFAIRAFLKDKRSAGYVCTGTPRRSPYFMKNRETPSEQRRKKAEEILQKLDALYPQARCSLDYGNAFQLLVATVLSAQCTDERVNAVTPSFFQRFPTPQAVVQGSVEEIERLIHPTGLYRNKARNIWNACRLLVERYGGHIPQTLEDLVQLPGIGRKSANVILGNAFGLAALPVDTHVTRVSRRLGLTDRTDPERIEQDLCALFPPEAWTRLSHQLIQHGRRVCRARQPLCTTCGLQSLCDFFRAGAPPDSAA